MRRLDNFFGSLKNKKGSAIIVEQVFIVLFGILLLVLVVVAFTSVRNKSVDYVASAQYENVANYVQSAIALASKNMRISDIGRIYLDVPDTIAGTTYRISIFNNTTIRVTNPSGSQNSSIGIFNVNATVLGNLTTTGGGRVYLEYNKTAGLIVLKAEERVIR